MLVFKRIECEDAENSELAMAEADILSSLMHEGIVAYEAVFDTFEEDMHIVTLVMEFCPGGSLLDYINMVCPLLISCLISCQYSDGQNVCPHYCTTHGAS